MPLPVDDELWGHVWAMDVAKTFSTTSVGDEVRLEFDDSSALPVEAQVYLVDLQMETVVDLRIHSCHAFYLAERARVSRAEDARFLIVVGSETFIDDASLPRPPMVTRLRTNRPNPFTQRTIVAYDVSKGGDATVGIFGAGGRRVRVLRSGYHGPGRYEIAWDGDDERGLPLASGVYFCRLRTAGGTDTHKIMLLR
jgi:hypothetical protein